MQPGSGLGLDWGFCGWYGGTTGSDLGLVWGSCGGCGCQPEVVWD